MSADDFQSKYASVMETMLKTAVAETTKLFETMVDELKAEISLIKKENEDLKTRCSQFEKVKSKATLHTGDSEPRDGSEKRDTAVQCDLVPFLVEQCQPLRHSSLQNQEQQCGYEEMEYGLQKDQDYEEGNSLMPVVKKEESYDSSCPWSVLIQEEVEPTVVCRQGLSDYADSPRASAYGTETEGLLINQDCSNREMTLPQRDEETQAAMEPPYMGMDSTLQGAQKQLSEPEHSQVISLAAGKYMKEASGVDLKISEIRTQGKLITTAEQPLVAAQQLSEVEPHEEEQPSVGETSNEQIYVTVHQYTGVQSTEEQLAHPALLNKEVAYEELKSGSTEGEASSKPGLSVRRRRGRPPKKAKLLQQPVTEILQSPSTNVPTDQEVLQAPSTEVSSSNETLNTPPAESVQAPSVQSRERRTSVTLQDAMLLVEAMNQSTVKNTFSPKRMVPPQIQCAPHVVTLQTVDEVSAQLPTPGSPPQKPLLPVVTHEVAVDLHVTEQSTTTQSTVDIPWASQNTDAIKSNKAQSVPQQPHAVTPSNNTTSLSSSTAATQTSVSLQQHPPHPLITSAVPSKPLSNAVPSTTIVVPRSLMPHTIAALSPTQLSAVVSTVAVAQNNSSLSAITAAGLPLGTHSLSSDSQKTIYVTSRKSHPVVTSQKIASSTHQQSGTLPYSKITLIIPRQVSAVASRKQQSQETLVPTTKQESAEPAPTVKVSSPPLVSSSEHISISVDTQTASDQEATTLSVGLVPISVSPEAPLTAEQKLSAVVRLSRLPFPMTTNESVLISRLLSDGSCEATKQEKPSSVVESTQPSRKTISVSEVPALSTDICPNLKETSVTMSECASQMSEELNDIQEKVSLSSETYTILDEAPVDGCVQPSTPSKVSAPVLEKSTIAVSMTESLAVSGTASEPTSNLDEEIISNVVQDCVLPNDPPIQEKETATFIQLTSKHIVDPHLQMTEAQFLAQLAVSPVVQAPKKASTNDFADARASCAETSAGDKRKLRKNSLLARLRSHLKTQLQARTETNPELITETETTPVSPKKPRLENVSQKERNSPSEPFPVSPKKPDVDNVTSLKNTTNDPTSISPRRSGLWEDGVRPKRTVSEPTSVSCRSKLPKNSPDPKSSTSESTPVINRRSSFVRDGVDPENTKSPSVSPRRSSSTKDGGSPKKTQFPRQSPRRSCSTKDGASTKMTKTTSESPRRCTSAKDNASPKKTQSTSLSPRRTCSTRDGATPKNTKSTSVSPKRCSSIRDGARPKKTKSTSASPRRSRSAREDASPKNTESTTSESAPVSLRRYTFTKGGSSAKQIKRQSNSLSPRRYSNTTDGGEIGTPSARSPKFAKDGTSPRKTGESTPAKSPGLIQDGPIPKKSLRLVNAKSLGNAAKAKTLPLMSCIDSNQSILQNGAKTSHLAKNGGSCEVVRRIRVNAVWTPPIMPASWVGKRSSHLPVKKETRSKIHTVVYPPIPVRGPPIVSPLQPLLVIGRCLLKNQCGECGRILSSSAALESHVSCHTGHGPFSCTFCGKSFPDSKVFKRHGRVHRNGRIHICQQCGKGFVYRFGLTKHLQMVHGRIKPFVCQICSKAFFTKRDVEAHIRIHTGEKPFHCNLCERRFARRVELNVHLRWHNGEKRHWCPYCGKGFLDSNNLKRHKYIHTGEKPHSCPHCPKNFTQSGHLKKHVKNVHKIQ